MSEGPIKPPVEIATNQAWRRKMIAARKAHGGEGMTQKELGARVGTSQNIISLIESGEITSSQFIGPICEVLKIPEPANFSNQAQVEWSRLGFILQHKDSQQFERLREFVRTLVGDECENCEDNEDAEH